MVDVGEFQTLLQQMNHSAATDIKNFGEITEDKLVVMMKKLGAEQRKAVGGTVLLLPRETMLKAASEGRVSDILGSKWVSIVEERRAKSSHLAGLLLLLFMLHAPVSQRLCHYFACDRVGTKGAGNSFLVQDYALKCFEGKHQEFIPVVVLFLALFTAGFPLGILGILCRNRRHLHTPDVQKLYGFLYSRFNVGSEMWELHEVFRKLILMGVLVFFPPTTRAAAAILICVIGCCSLNYLRPHRNHVVLGVSQLAFLLQTFKYISAVLLTPGRDGSLSEPDRVALGWLMIFMDVLFMVGSVAAMAAVMWLLRSKAAEMREDEKASSEGGGGAKDRAKDTAKDTAKEGKKRASSTTKVAPK